MCLQNASLLYGFVRSLRKTWLWNIKGIKNGAFYKELKRKTTNVYRLKQLDFNQRTGCKKIVLRLDPNSDNWFEKDWYNIAFIFSLHHNNCTEILNKGIKAKWNFFPQILTWILMYALTSYFVIHKNNMPFWLWNVMTVSRH